MRRLRLFFLAAAVMAAAVAGTVLAVAVNVATGGTTQPMPILEQHPWWLSAAATIAVAASGLLVWWTQRAYERGLTTLVPVAQRPEPWIVERPDEVDRIVSAVRRRRAATVGITTAVHGAGGFGKTTMARLVCADRRVRRRFGGQVYWVTLGRDVPRDSLAQKVNDLVRQIDPTRAEPFTDVRQAAEHLAKVLAAGPPRLVVLDDVWFENQLAAFPVAGSCARMVTTRVTSLVAGRGVPVKVDQMSVAQARSLLVSDLPHLPEAAVDGLLAETGRWPLLLRLVNRLLLDQTILQTDVTVVVGELLERLQRDGALQVDRLTGATDRLLNVDDPDQRDKAVAATIEASTGLLSPGERERFAELAIFAEDEAVSVEIVTTLWQATGGLDVVATRALCTRLADLALLTLNPADRGGTIGLHDVVRDYLHDELGEVRVTRLHRLLIETVAADIPHPPAVPSHERWTEMVAWWQLPESPSYLWDHLIEHLLAANLGTQANATVCDLRWVSARLERSGPMAPFADLVLVDTSRAARLCRLLGQIAHLLLPTDPPYSLVDILYSRVAHDPDWGHQVQALVHDRRQPLLINQWPIGPPPPASRRTLIGHGSAVRSVAIAPDGMQLISISRDGAMLIFDAVTGEQRARLGISTHVSTAAFARDGSWLATVDNRSVRIWDTVTGEQRGKPAGRRLGLLASMTAVAIAPDGSWLATAGHVMSVRIWDAATAKQRAKLTGRCNVEAVAIAPDGSWLATGSDDRSVRILDTATGKQRAELRGPGLVVAVAIAPDGTWLATGGDPDGSVRIWDTATGKQRATLTGHTCVVAALAIAPDGSWMATGSYDRSVRIWDTGTGKQRAILTGHSGWVCAVAIAPDGSWLATGSEDESVRIWDAVTKEVQTKLTGHNEPVDAVAITPDGSWLATCSDHRSLRIFDTGTGEQRAELEKPGVVRAVAIAPDGSWLATGDADGSVRLWDTVTGEQRATLTGHSGWVCAVAIASDGSWLATGDDEGSVRIWDAVTGKQRATLTGHSDWSCAVAIAPSGSWLATQDGKGSVRIWDTVTGTQRATLTGKRHRQVAVAIAIAPDGNWLATSDDRSVRIWDATTGEQRARLTGHGSIRAVAIAPDGNWLATGNVDGSVRIWDPATGDCSAVTRIAGEVRACAWHPTASALVVGGSTGLYQFRYQA